MIVGAADKKEKKGKYQLADFSNYGENVDICAPGVDIYTSKKAESADKSKYASVQGTSVFRTYGHSYHRACMVSQ